MRGKDYVILRNPSCEIAALCSKRQAGTEKKEVIHVPEITDPPDKNRLALRLTQVALLVSLAAAVEPSSALTEDGSLHAVYVMSNAAEGSEILVLTPNEG